MNPATTSEPRPAEIASAGDGDPAEAHEDPHDRLTPEQRARFEAYMAEPKELPKSCVDPATGRALPISREEMSERVARWLERSAEIDAQDDDPPWMWEQIEREMNEERALEGRGPAFPEGRYGEDRRTR